MANMFKKTFAMMLVMCMLVSMLPIQALAEDEITPPEGEVTLEVTGETPTVVIDFTPGVDDPIDPVLDSQLTTGDDIKVEATYEKTETTEEDGSTVVTETVTTTTEGTLEDGSAIKGEETYVETTTTTATPDSTITGNAAVLEGSEEITISQEEVQPGDTDIPDVNVNFTPSDNAVETEEGVFEETVTETEGNVITETTVKHEIDKETGDTTVTVNVTESTITNVSGDVADGASDPNYNYTEEKNVTEREVVVEIVNKDTVINDVDTGLVGEQEAGLSGIGPVYDETDNEVRGSNGRIKDSAGKDGVFDRNYLSQSNADPSKWVDKNGNSIMPDEAEFRYIGTGEHSKYFVGFMNVVYKKDDAGNILYDENGEPVIDELLTSADTPILIDGEAASELLEAHEYDGYSGSRAQNFMLMDKNGNRVFGYCADLKTGADSGEWYHYTNLEDSNYYASEESADHIRSIVMNGYWGTSDIPKEDGSYELGSLEGIKANLRKAIENGEISGTVLVPQRNVDDNGNVVLDENGEVVTVEMNVLDFLDGMTEGEAMLATQAAIWSYANGTLDNPTKLDGPIVVSPDWYRNHQTNYGKHEGEPLDDEAGARVDLLYKWLMNLETEEKSTVVINDQSSFEDVNLLVHEKDAEAEANKDDNKDNDVYNVDLTFKLAFVPGDDDDLVVYLLDSENNPIKDKDGNPIIKRLAGENSEGQDYDDIRPEADGSYVLKGLKLSENQDFDFDLRLEGTQYLEKGVYVYTAVGGRDVSQSFVGIAEGKRNVDVSMGMTIRFDVDENHKVVAEKHWRSSHDPVTEDKNPPIRFRTPGPVIPDEPVPLADVPQTGDISVLWFAMILFSGCGLCALKLFEKKFEA